MDDVTFSPIPVSEDAVIMLVNNDSDETRGYKLTPKQFADKLNGGKFRYPITDLLFKYSNGEITGIAQHWYS